MGSRQPFDLVAAARRCLTEYGFEPDYPVAVQQEVAALQTHPPKSNPAAEDLRHLLWSSIDNDTSRDLDQIEYAESLPDGRTRVLIGIADVDEFVPKGSAMDQFAAQQTVTLYTGVKTFSMLPETLSTGLTSLLEEQDCACMVTEFVLDGNRIKLFDWDRERASDDGTLNVKFKASAGRHTVAVTFLATNYAPGSDLDQHFDVILIPDNSAGAITSGRRGFGEDSSGGSTTTRSSGNTTKRSDVQKAPEEGVAARPRATRASREAARRSFPSSSSSSAMLAMMLVTARPVGVLVSTPSRSDRTWTPRLVSSWRAVATSRTERPSRSTATTTR